MSLYVVTAEELHAFRVALVKDLQEILSQSDPLQNQWVQESEAAKMLSMAKSTLKEYRKKGLIPFSKLGDFTYYSVLEIHKQLEKNITVCVPK